MKEQIILTPGINGDELLRSLAANNINCFNVRIMNATGLARYALMKSGISVETEFVSVQEECMVVAKAIKDISYFEKATYADIVDLTSAIRTMRYLVSDEDEAETIAKVLPKGIFIEKNKALLSAYKGYIDHLDGMDTVGLIRKAVKECNQLDAEFITVKEVPLKPLEKSLLNKLSGGLDKEISLAELYHTTEHGIKVESFKNCYGAPNEIEEALTQIYSGNQMDQCVIALADTSAYVQNIFDLSISKKIPITFGCGVPITNSNPAQLLNLYNRWMTTGLFSASALDTMLSSNYFDKKKFFEDVVCTEDVKVSDICTLLEQLKLSNNEAANLSKVDDYLATIPDDENKSIIGDCLKSCAQKLALPCEDFVYTYSRIRASSDEYTFNLLNRIDNVALSIIYNALSIVRNSEMEQNVEDVISDVLSRMICSQRSEPGKLHVCTINQAISTLRNNIYVMGLSANSYPGTPKENYLLLDEDLMLFGDLAEHYTSVGKIKEKRERLFTLTKLATALESKIYVSFAGFNVSELKQQNASSMIFDLYKQEHGETATIKDLEENIVKVEYFTPRIDATREIGKAYNDGANIVRNDKGTASVSPRITTDGKSYSPSALNTFFECRKKYMYKYILDLPEAEEDNPFEVITAADQGTLAHSLMEELANSPITKEDFLKLAATTFEEYLKTHPAMIQNSVATEKEQFIDMMESAYDGDPHRKVVLKEEDKTCSHPAGITIHGFPDRVEQVGPNEYIIVDFKTGRRVKHVKDDIYSCLQVVIYAYLMEQEGYKISRGEFRYIRIGETITCEYNDGMKLALGDALNEFIDAVKHNEFICTDPDDKGEPCKYCSYAKLCNRVELEEEE